MILFSSSKAREGFVMVRARRASMTREKASEKKCFAGRIRPFSPEFIFMHVGILTRRHGEYVSESGNM